MTITLRTHLTSAQANTTDESLITATKYGAQALIWQGSQGLVVPRTYTRNPLFKNSLNYFQQLHWPISIRQSGGGVVPQGPGIWNISLAWRQYAHPIKASEKAYKLLCQPIQAALLDCGIPSDMQTVIGSFCDGRFNIAVEHQQKHKKIVGTAQVWKRCQAPSPLLEPTKQSPDLTAWHVVLCHALLLIDADVEAITAKANHLEQILHRNTRYKSGRICSLSQINGSASLFLQRLQYHLSRLNLPQDQGFPGN